MGTARLSTDDDVLDAVRALLETRNNSARQLLLECEDAASGHIPRSAGASRGRARDSAQAADADSLEAIPVASSDGRCAGLADALTKAGYSMQNELLRDKIFNLVVEWCDSPQTRSAGISYTDCAFLYDQIPGQNVTSARGVPDENIYVHIPHPLLGYGLDDPVLQSAQRALTQFYSETFWLNNDATCLPTSVLRGLDSGNQCVDVCVCVCVWVGGCGWVGVSVCVCVCVCLRSCWASLDCLRAVM